MNDLPWAKRLDEEFMNLWDLCDTRPQQVLLKELVYKMYVLDSDNEFDACAKINDQVQLWELDPDTSLITAVANAKEIDGSTAGLQKLKNKIKPAHDWHSKFMGNIPAAVEKVKNGDSIILFDDFIGSGKKMVRKYNWFKNSVVKSRDDDVDLNTLKFYFVSFSAMKFGLKYIELETGLPVFTFIALDKGISGSYAPDVVNSKLELMREIEEKLALNFKNKKLVDYSCGYEQSECLYIWQNDNCPNNVFFTGGKVLEQMISNIDLMPTLLEFIGAKIPENIEGRAFYPS